jgi:DNA-binding transcriptional ArsR family regulator
MTKEELEGYLAQGLSLEQIGKRVGRNQSTISYHLKKHGLTPVGQPVHAPNGKVDPARLRELIESGATVRETASALNIGYSTVRYWLKRLGLETQTVRRRREEKKERAKGAHGVRQVCPKHGKTIFVSRPDGGYRCGKCRMAAVGKWRRRVKERLVLRAGGACEVCGYRRYYGALQFHHLDPSSKQFSISRNGTTRSYEEVCAEADKCVLLCANCHAEVEAGLVKLSSQVAPLRLRAT